MSEGYNQEIQNELVYVLKKEGISPALQERVVSYLRTAQRKAATRVLEIHQEMIEHTPKIEIFYQKVATEFSE